VTAARQARFWLVGLGLLLIAVYLLRGILLPFVAGMALAYLLDPLCDRLQRWGCSRVAATVAVTTCFVLAAAAAVVLVVPLVHGQIVDLAERLPGYLDSLQRRLEPLLGGLQQQFAADGLTQVRTAMGGQAGELLRWLGGALGSLLSGGLVVLNLLSLLLITPVVAFYLLRDWDRLVARIDHWLPRRQAPVIREQLRLIDRTLAGYARGQATVCLVLGLFYGLGLSLIGLDAGLVVGVAVGVLSFVPFVGALPGFGVGLALAFAQFALWTPILLVGALFVAGQILEGYVLTPKLIGDRVGLHPVWVIFALLAGGALFGFVGVLLGLPAAAAVGVLARFALARYLASRYYQATDELPPAGSAP